MVGENSIRSILDQGRNQASDEKIGEAIFTQESNYRITFVLLLF